MVKKFREEFCSAIADREKGMIRVVELMHFVKERDGGGPECEDKELGGRGA